MLTVMLYCGNITGDKNYLLFPEDIEIDELSLKRGRIVKKEIVV